VKGEEDDTQQALVGAAQEHLNVFVRQSYFSTKTGNSLSGSVRRSNIHLQTPLKLACYIAFVESQSRLCLRSVFVRSQGCQFEPNLFCTDLSVA